MLSINIPSQLKNTSMSTQPKSALQDVHTIVTLQFIKQLENGVIPWHVAWEEHPQTINGYPMDHINVWLLAHLPYSRNVFLTSRQMNRFKVKKKRGEKGHTTIGIRHSTNRPTFYCSEVYNVEQLEFIYDDIVPPQILVGNPLEKCAMRVTQMPKFPRIIWKGSTVYYNLKEDVIYLPAPGSFDTTLRYHSALFYGLAQCSGHAKRRNRDTCIHRNSNDPNTFSLEDLVIEMAASYLCSISGIEPWYLTHFHNDSKGWLRRLQTDSTLVITAAMYAQEAVNFILNRSALANPIQTGVFTPAGKR
jgi:antirestriction protein ArdC